MLQVDINKELNDQHLQTLVFQPPLSIKCKTMLGTNNSNKTVTLAISNDLALCKIRVLCALGLFVLYRLHISF